MSWITLAVLVTAGWPGRAPASCGDYVTMQPHQDSASEQVQPPAKSPVAELPSAPGRAPLPGTPGPGCRGAQCVPPAAPLTSAKPAPPRDDLGAAVRDANETAITAAAAPVVLQEFAAPSGYRSSIYHPPR